MRIYPPYFVEYALNSKQFTSFSRSVRFRRPEVCSQKTNHRKTARGESSVPIRRTGGFRPGERIYSVLPEVFKASRGTVSVHRVRYRSEVCFHLKRSCPPDRFVSFAGLTNSSNFIVYFLRRRRFLIVLVFILPFFRLSHQVCHLSCRRL